MEQMKEEFLGAYDEHADALFRHCLFKVSDRETATDILQDTFVKAWNHLSSGGRVESWRPFLYKVLNNLVIDYYRKKKSDSLDALREEGFDPAKEDPSFIDRLDGEMAIRYLSRLPDDYREALFLRYVEGLDLSEIADITGEKENTVAVRIHRGLHKLKIELKLES